MVGKEDFEAGMYGNTLARIMSCLSETEVKGWRQLLDETGLGGKDFEQGLSRLEKLGYVTCKRLHEGIGDNLFYLKHSQSERPSSSSSLELGASLMELDPQLERRRSGAWQALQSATDDRYSQAATSMREVLRQLLDKLAPDRNVIDATWYRKPRQGASVVTRAMKVRYAVGGKSNSVSESTLRQINALAHVVDTTYARLSSEVHKEPASQDNIARALLKACESLMELILAERARG